MDKCVYDIAFLGHYTKDTIISTSGIKTVNGGAFYYGANVAARMSLKTAAVTRLAREDLGIAEELKNLGVDLFFRTTPVSTCLRLEYPSSNPDEREIFVTSSAGAFRPEEVQNLEAKNIVLGGSIRGEIGPDVLEELYKKETRIALDVQGFLRVVRRGKLVNEVWPEMSAVLAHVDLLKTDSVEAEMITGKEDIRTAARYLGALGPKEILLTHRKGVVVHAQGQFYEADFFPAELVGRSGRGDTCLAAYTARRISSPPAEAVIWAAAVTSLKMESDGPFRRDISAVEALIGKKYL